MPPTHVQAFALATALLLAGCETPLPPTSDPDPSAVRLEFPSRAFEASATSAGGSLDQRVGRASPAFALVFLDEEGLVLVPRASDRVELRTSGGGGLAASSSAGTYTVVGAEAGQGFFEVLFIRGKELGEETVFTSAPIPVLVRPLPERAVLELGDVTVTTTAEEVEGALSVRVGEPGHLVVSLLRPDGEPVTLLEGESVEVILAGGGNGIDVEGDAPEWTLSATGEAEDLLRVSFLSGTEELVVFRDVPVIGVQPPCDGPTSGGLCLREITRGLTFPVTMVQAPGDDRLLVVRQEGFVNGVAPGGAIDFFLDMRDEVTFASEQGLLGFAFHPDYETNRTFFIHYKDLNKDMVLARMTAEADGRRADPASRETVLVIPHDSEAGPHNAGHILFGPDGYLWVTSGDGLTHPDRSIGQDLTDLRGSLLRIDVAPAPEPAGYTIPADNPFAEGAEGARGEIVHYGFRNPWQIHIDPLTRLLYVADVGETQREEVNVVPLGDLGSNFGWNVMEGTHCRIADCSAFELTTVLPAYEYATRVEGDAVIGGRVYRGMKVPVLQGKYVFGDHRGFIRSVDLEGGAPDGLVEHFGNGDLFEDDTNPGLITAFATDADGELYVLMLLGRIYRIEAAP